MTKKLKQFDVKTGRSKKEYREYEEIERHTPYSFSYKEPATHYNIFHFWRPIRIEANIKEAKK